MAEMLDTMDMGANPYKIQVEWVVNGVCESQNDGYDAIQDLQKSLAAWMEEQYPDFRIVVSGSRCVEVGAEEQISGTD